MNKAVKSFITAVLAIVTIVAVVASIAGFVLWAASYITTLPTAIFTVLGTLVFAIVWTVAHHTQNY